MTSIAKIKQDEDFTLTVRVRDWTSCGLIGVSDASLGDSMQFCADLLSEILGESAPSSKNLHLKQSAIEWHRTIVTDALDVYDKVSTEKGGLPQQKRL